eukprot:TRINITY_DN1277_c0_g1_i1.p1 TRINITY_DN1277_c0_g1~~TRINITY_DN1277_c0_g1_i1.p1  ORF type:complete len:690 (+),score=160.85 TRINITY_DN1277_c0_g1_i1:285-2354(+)
MSVMMSGEVVTVHLTGITETALVVFVLVLITTVFKLLFHKLHWKWIPESAAFILLGCVIGTIILLAGVGDRSILHFNAELFFVFLIPPIIFEAGYHLDKQAFFENIKLILALALIGTFIATMITGFIIWGASEGGIFVEPMNLAIALTFGALISAVDPVAVLAIFEAVHVNATLNILVFGESVVNDAVSIVLYRLFLSFNELDGSFGWELPFLGLAKFLYVVVVGVALGFIFALLAAFLTKYTWEDPIMEPIIVFVCAFLSYIIADVVSSSGIVAILVAGITMSRYVEANINRKSHTTIKVLSKALAQTSDTVIFTYLGLSTILHLFQDINHFTERWDFALIAITLVTIFVVRFSIVYSFMWIANRRQIAPIRHEDQFVIAYGGLRGAIAFALAFIMEEETGSVVPAHDTILTTTLFIIWFSVFVQGTSIKPILRLLHVRLSSDDKPNIAQRVFPKAFEHIVGTMGLISGHTGGGVVGSEIWQMFDRLLTALFVRGLFEEEEELIRGLRHHRKMELNKALDEEDGAYVKDDHKHRANLRNPRVNLTRVMAQTEPLRDGSPRRSASIGSEGTGLDDAVDFAHFDKATKVPRKGDQSAYNLRAHRVINLGPAKRVRQGSDSDSTNESDGGGGNSNGLNLLPQIGPRGGGGGDEEAEVRVSFDDSDTDSDFNPNFSLSQMRPHDPDFDGPQV